MSTSHRLVDSHAHLQAPAFAPDRDDVLAAARSGGVVRVLAPGWDVQSSRASVELARASGVDASAGIHPHGADGVEAAGWAEIVGLAADPAVVAVGETGLDYDRAFSGRDNQLANLRRHLDLSRRIGKPLILHCRSKRGRRDAHDDLLSELESAGAGSTAWPVAPGAVPGVLHSFSGPIDYAERALAMGFAVSFSGLVFRRGEEASAEVARLVPLDRLLTETDSPYLSPPGAPRGRNQPRYVAITAGWLAEQRGVNPIELGRRLVANYDRMFRRGPLNPRPTSRAPSRPAP